MTKLSLNSSISSRLLRRYSSLLLSFWKKIPLIDRWIIGELIPPFLFAISAFTVVSLSVGVMFDLIRKIVESGLSLDIALKVLLLNLPSFLVISFPMAVLMATLLAYSKMSSNSELKALQSIGISIKRSVISALVLGIIMTGMTFFFNDLVVPNANKQAELTLKRGLGVSWHSDYAEDIMYSRFGEIVDPITSEVSKGMTHLFYANKFQNKTMKDVTVLDFSREGFTQMLKAEKALWRDSQAQWQFYNGNILTLSPNGSSTSVAFEKYIYPLLDSGPRDIAEVPPDANNMTLAQAYKAQMLYEKTGNIKEIRRIKVRIQEKFTLPIACIVFALIGASLGSKPNMRTNQSQGFGLSVILILIYYVLSFSFSSLGVSGIVNPIIAPWIPVLISLSGGFYLLNEVSK